MSCDNIKSDLSLDSRLEEILEWLNEIEFSRPKKILGRDFADGSKKINAFCLFVT